MSKEKQIEEMDCEKCLHYFACLVNSEYVPTPCPAYEDKAGYRKQEEGEWIKHPCSYECTVCKEEFFVEGYAEDYDPIADWDLHFCPNCGAKMKGGAE